MDNWVQFVMTICGSVIASSGFWAFVMSQKDKRDDKTKMLVGLAHDRIIALGMGYVTRGYILKDEYEDLRVYLYEPYRALGGNGSAERVMTEVDKLPLFLTITEARLAGFDGLA